jgi:Methyltransferase domain
VHTFDPTVSGEVMERMSKEAGYHFHLWGLGSQADMNAGVILGNGPLKTLEAIMGELGHTGRTIDVFKIDCEGCEYTVMQDQVFGPVVAGALKVGQFQVIFAKQNIRV